MWDVKYRPKLFSEVLGQRGLIEVLVSRLKAGKACDTSYVFSGGFGQGKTTLARILGRAILCLSPDSEGNPCNECDHCKSCLNETMPALTELDAASQGTTADMRRLVDGLEFKLPGIQSNIYIIDESHRMSRDAQDVLLKPVEDKRVVIIFCTTELHKIRDAIRSRCELYELRRIDRDEILERVRYILQAEGVTFEDDAVLTVIDHSGGHVRDVLNNLETIAQLGPITLDAVRERLHLTLVTQYYDVLLSLGDPSKSVQMVDHLCDKVGPSEVLSGLAEAAMNSYRLANRMHTDFTQFDAPSAQKVWDLYGENLLGICRYFLRLRNPTTLDLLCDVAELSKSEGKIPVVVEAPVAPPVQVVAPVPVVPPTESSTKSEPQETPSQQQPTKETKLSPASKPPSATVSVKAVSRNLTSLDSRVIKRDLPRGAERGAVQAAPKERPAKNGSLQQILTPSEFQVALDKLLKMNGGTR